MKKNLIILSLLISNFSFANYIYENSIDLQKKDSGWDIPVIIVLIILIFPVMVVTDSSTGGLGLIFYIFIIILILLIWFLIVFEYGDLHE